MVLNINDLDLKNYVKNACKDKGISFRQLGFRIKMSDIGLSKTLNNKTIKLSTLIDISNALEVDLMQLIFGKSFGAGSTSFELIKAVHDENTSLKGEIKRLTEQLEDKRQIIDLIKKDKVIVVPNKPKPIDYNIDLNNIEAVLKKIEIPDPEKEKLDELINRMRLNK